MPKLRVSAIVLFVAGALLLPERNQAQISTATLVGTVLDASGASVPAAVIEVEHRASGARRQTQTDSSGAYTVPLLQPGIYNVTVSKPGFGGARRENVQLNVDQTARLDITIELGTVQQVIDVTTAPPILETATAGLGTVMEERKIVDLPLNGRQFAQLMTLVPGVVPVDVSQNTGSIPALGGAAAPIPSVNGQTNRSNLFFLDGMYASNPFFGGFSVSPSVDVIQEFKVQSHSDQAEVGQSQGGTVNLVTKSGTNEFHGALFHFLRNDKLDARPFFAATRGGYKQNQFGGTLGGPIVKQKLLFFGYYEGYRARQASAVITRVPTSAELSGDFSGPFNNQIYNPFTTRADPNNPGQFIRDPFPGNRIPSNLLDRNSLLILSKFVPAANFVGQGGRNYINTQSLSQDQDQFGGRVDYNLNSRNILYGRFSMGDASKLTPQAMPTTPFITGFNGRNAVANLIHTFSPTLILQLSGGWNYIVIPQRYDQPDVPGLFAETGFDQWFPPRGGGTGIDVFPSVSATGYMGTGAGWGPIGPNNVYQYSGTLSKMTGRHDLKFGAVGYHLQVFTNWAGKGYGFGTDPTADPQRLATTGNGLASMLLGLPTSASRQLGDSSVDMRSNVMGFFFQDSFKATSKLTINFGLRWDYTQPVREVKNRWSGFDIYTGQWVMAKDNADAPNPLPAGVTMLDSHTILPSDKKNFSPRLGFAYQLTSKTVIRTGVGIYWDNWAGIVQNTQGPRGNWPSGANQATPPNQNRGPVELTLNNPFAALGNSMPATPFPSGNWSFDRRLKNSYSTQWNFEIQQQLTNSMALSAAYVGSRTNRIGIQVTQNLALTPGPGPVAPRRPFPNMLGFPIVQGVGRGHYESLQMKLNKRFTEGLTFITSYTWSKNIDMGCAGVWEGCSIQNPYRLDLERAVSALDVPHLLTNSVVYELPFGRGKRFLADGGVAAAVLGGWQLNSIMMLRSGSPYNIGIGFDNANVGGGSQRPNLVGDPELPNPSSSRWFNTAAFAVPAPYTFGNLGRNVLRADGRTNFDFSIFRNFTVWERHTLQLRGEFFNAFNHQDFGAPDTGMQSASFGQVFSATTPRDIQLALKYTF